MKKDTVVRPRLKEEFTYVVDSKSKGERPESYFLPTKDGKFMHLTKSQYENYLKMVEPLEGSSGREILFTRNARTGAITMEFAGENSGTT